MTRNPVVVPRDATLDTALEQLEEYGFRHLPVLQDGRVVGIVSDRDLCLATSRIAARWRLKDPDGRALPGPQEVGEIMSSPVFCLPSTATAASAAEEMVAHRIGAIPIVEDDGLLGILTETDLLRAFTELCQAQDGACDDLVRYHMRTPLPSVPSDMGVADALDEMDARSAHLGIREGGRLVGFLSHRDLLLGLARERIEDAMAQEAGRMYSSTRTVADFMSVGIHRTEPGQGLMACAKTMLHKRVSALPVFEDGEPIGLLTQRDLLEYYASLHSPRISGN